MANCSGHAGRPQLPPDDLALFSGLQPHEVRAVAESRIQAYRAKIEDMNRYIIELFTIQNTTVPLHVTLPPEVLMNVFRHVFPTRRSHIRLTHVCKLWRDLIRRTPEFWADMLGAKAVRLDHDSDHPYRDDLSLIPIIERSSPAPYKLVLKGDLAIADLAIPHMSRICALSWELLGFDSLAQLPTLLDLDMPHLEVLRCTYYMGPGTLVSAAVRQLSRGKGEFPRLRRLTLIGGLACPGFAFPSLKELKVEDGENPQSFHLLVELLRSSPQLQTLEVILRTPFLDDGPPLSRDAMVSLPHLTVCSISLHTSEEPGAYHFLQHVRLPATAQLKSTWLDGYDHSLSALIPAYPETFHALHALTIRYFALDDDDADPWVLRACGYDHRSPKPRLRITTHFPCWSANDELTPSLALVDFATLFYDARRTIRSVRISLESKSAGLSVERDDWHALLNTFPALSSLTVRIDSCRNLLAVLRKNPAQWPALRRLSISCRNGSGVHECLLSVVENRAREGLRLKFLAFSGDRTKPLSVHRIRRLQALVREVIAGDSDSL